VPAIVRGRLQSWVGAGTLNMVSATLSVGLISYMASAATGGADPIQAFANAVDNIPLLTTALIRIIEPLPLYAFHLWVLHPEVLELGQFYRESG